MDRMLRRLCQCLSPYDWDDRTPDPTRRRYTFQYRRKREWVKNCWICGGVLALAIPAVSIVLALGLATTLLSFMLLDETG